VLVRKKPWGRLGAAVGSVALLAGGLVGVAAPAQADGLSDRVQCASYERQKGDWVGDERFWEPEWPEVVAILEANCSAAGYTQVITGFMSGGSIYKCGANPSRQDCSGFGYPGEPVQKRPPPPPCWDSAINNCPVGGALTFSAPKYAMVGVPVTMYAYASWRPDANSPAQPTDGTAVIRVDGEDYSGVAFNEGVAEWTFVPKEMGEKNFTVSGVVSSGLSGASAYIDSVPASTYVVPYDPEFLTKALKDWRVDIGEKFVITDRDQALSHAKKRYKWSVAPKSEDVCAVYKTKKGEVKAKFNDYGECTVRWLDRKSAEEGKYTFIVTKPKLNID